MPVLVGSNLIEPAPFVNISKELTVAGNQTKISQTYRLTIEGDLIAYMGSPQGGSLANANWGGPFGLFWQSSAPAPSETGVSPNITHHLYNIEAKQRAMEALFAVNGSTIEWQSPDGSQPLKAQFKNANVVWQASNWAQTCHYQITAECDLLYLLGNTVNDVSASGFIQQASEAWNIDLGEAVKTFNVQHTANAVGKIAFDSLGNVTQPAWMNARDYVLTQLVLGFSGVSSYSNVAGATIFKQSALASGVLNLNNYTPYKHSLTESVDELAGSYSITETYTLAPTSSGSHIYTVSTRRIVDDPYTNIVSSIQGTIVGYYDRLFNYDQRIPAAEYVWSQLAAPTGLLSLIQSTYNPNVTGTFYNIQPRQGSIDYNINDGTLQYNYEFANTLYQGDAFDQWTITRKTSADNYITTFGINGNVKGRRYDGDTDVKTSFVRAYTYWSSLSGSNYNTLFQRVLNNTYFPEASGMGVQPSPIDKSVDINESEGLISYAFAWNNRQVDGPNDDSVKEEYTIGKRFSVDDGITVYTIAGSVEGLNVQDINPQQSKFGAATGYFYNYTVPNMLQRIQTYFNVTLPDTRPLATEVTLQPIVGAITFSYEFRNTFPPILSGVLSEHIVITDLNPGQQMNVIARVPVPGRPQGEVLQDVATSVAKTRTVNVEAVLAPTGGTDLLSAYNAKPNYDSYILQLKPTNAYITNWQPVWDFKMGRYSLTVEYLYE